MNGESCAVWERDKKEKRRKRRFRLRTALAVLACRGCSALLQKLGRGGSSLPGLLALALDREILGELAQGVEVTAVTGTNGKTTTCGMISQIFQKAKIRHLSNASGANLIQGIVTAFALNSSLSGGCRYSRAVIECDEGTLRQVAGALKIRCLVVTNLFRDQEDRFGDPADTAGLLREGIRQIPGALLCLNADCPLTSSLAEGLPNPVVWFGVEDQGPGEAVQDQPEELRCSYCGSRYEYSRKTYGCLGDFYCPECGHSRMEPETAVTRVLNTGRDASEFLLRLEKKEWRAQVNLSGYENLYNAAAAAAAAGTAGISPENRIQALAEYSCCFGRGEEAEIGWSRVRMFLTKNPVGFNLAIRWILGEEQECNLVFLLNDRPADGKDISWIRKTDLEALAREQQRFPRLLVSGLRRKEMAERLREAGFEQGKVEEIQDLRVLLETVGAQGTPAVLLANYTALYELRRRM